MSQTGKQPSYLCLCCVGFLFVCFFVVGCSSYESMALSNVTQVQNLDGDGIVLMSLKISNKYKPEYQPRDAGGYSLILFTIDKATGNKHMFRGERPYKHVAKQFSEYLVSIRLPAGKYRLTWITGTCGWVFMGVGEFAIPVFSDFEIESNKIVYLGRIEATNRKKCNPDELKAGRSYPLIDQKRAGFSDGTFDIKIFDNYEKDIAIFKQKYPMIRNNSVKKGILPPWKKTTDEEIKNGGLVGWL